MSESSLLIATDLDRTLLPNGAEPEAAGSMALFARLAALPAVNLAYVSGRHRELVEDAIAEFGIPRPDFVIGDVGTSIYHVDRDGRWSQPTSWEDDIAGDWGGRDATTLAKLLDDIEALRLQPPDRQNRCKLSYFVPMGLPGRELEPEILERLGAEGIAARLVWSIDEPAATGLLDILPARASKLHALEALMLMEGFSPGHTVFCGDSGNDLEVLASPVPAVLVGNAQADVRELALRLARQEGWEDRLYIARGGYLGMNGNYSAGMLEGIAHYHPEVTDWLAAESGTKED